MEGPANAFELLDKLRETTGRQRQRFNEIANFIGYKARERGVPVSGQFELTPLCNFSCKMCYVHLNADQLKGQPVLPAETWKDLIRQAWEAGMLEATLTGGECLAYPGFEEIFLYLHSLGCEVAILTNGYLMDEKRIEFFKAHKPARIQVTLYGWNDDVYERVTGKRAFGTVSENIRRAVEARLPVYLNVTPSAYLGEDIFETIRVGRELCQSVSVNSCIFPPRDETGRSGQRDDPDEEMYTRIYRYQDELDGKEACEISEDQLPPCGGPSHECAERGLRCGGGRSGFVMTWKGEIAPCNQMEMIHANALEEGFSSAWAKINREANNWPRVPECEGCAYDGICNNCAANILRFTEPGKRPEALCGQTRYYVRHGVRPLPECE